MLLPVLKHKLFQRLWSEAEWKKIDFSPQVQAQSLKSFVLLMFPQNFRFFLHVSVISTANYVMDDQINAIFVISDSKSTRVNFCFVVCTNFGLHRLSRVSFFSATVLERIYEGVEEYTISIWRKPHQIFKNQATEKNIYIYFINHLFRTIEIECILTSPVAILFIL